MVTINKNSANIVTVTVTELTTISPVNYLIEFKDKLTKELTYCLLGANRSDFTDRFDEFLITEKTTPSQIASEIELNKGQQIYTIYELTDAQVSALNFASIDVTDYGIVEGGGQAIVFGTDAVNTTYPDAVSTNTFYNG